MTLLGITLRGFYKWGSILPVLLLFLPISPTFSQVVFVDAGSPCVSGCGDSWANAYSDLNEAIQETDAGEIWVAKGTYLPTVCPGTCQNIDRLETFELKNNVALYGGFFGNETALEQRDIVVNETFLSGNIGFGVTQNDNSFHVVSALNVDSTAVLDGFIIRDGLADGTFGTNNESGAALYLQASNMGKCSPVIRNCVFTANMATGGGGAVYVQILTGSSAAPSFEDCQFLENRTEGASSGGAVAMEVTDGGSLAPVFSNCVFEGNEAGDNGGAIAFFANNFNTISQPVIEFCSFSNNNATNFGGGVFSRALDNATHQVNVVQSNFFRNEASSGGGGLYDQASFGAVSTTRILNSTFTENLTTNDGGGVFLRGSQMGNNFSLLFNCIFNNNSASDQGGALFTTSALDGVDLGVCRPEITNSTFYNNSADGAGSALFNEFSNAELYNSILWDEDEEIGNNNANPIIENCIIKGGYNGAGTFANILDTDPFFLFPERGDFNLSYCSPAIDVGDGADIPIDSTDLDGDNVISEQIDVDADDDTRTFGATVDLGAFEWNGSPMEGEVIFVKWDASGMNDGSTWDNAFTDLQSALDAAYPCSDIWVAAGTYRPNDCVACTDLEQAISFRMKSQVGIYGGFSGVETMLEERDIATNVSFLSGNIGDENSTTDNAYHVVVAQEIDSTGILDGFTILEGNASNSDEVGFSYGGGLFISASEDLANPSIRNCTFRNNEAKSGGGAVYVGAEQDGVARPNFENCDFVGNNTAISGGAIYHFASTGANLEPVYKDGNFLGNGAQFEGGAVFHLADGAGTSTRIMYLNCDFENNNAGNGAGAMLNRAANSATQRVIVQNGFMSNNVSGGVAGAIFDDAILSGNSQARIINIVFRENRANRDGGAIYLQGNQAGTNRGLLFNLLFDQNVADGNGGGVYHSGSVMGTNTGNCEPTLINLTFAGNGAQSGQAISNDFANPEINNCILWDGGDEIVDVQSSPIVQNSIIQGGYNGNGFVTNVIDEEPLFLDEAGDDFRLVSCSPGVDQGLTGIIPFDLTDVDADNDDLEQIDIDLLEGLRIFGDQIDLGAFEWNGFPEAISLEIEKTDVSCFGFCNGNVSIDPSGGTGNFLISWEDSNDAFSVENLCAGNYKITVTDGSLCTAVDSIEITEMDELLVEVTPDTTVCEGTMAPLSVQGIGGAGGYTYLWSDNLGDTEEVAFSPAESQDVFVVVTDDNGCVKIDTVSIDLAMNPVPSISGPTEVCPGDSISLQTDDYQAYAWSSGAETNAINVSEEGTYEVTVTDTNGCSGTAMTEVAALETPEPQIEGDTSYCFGANTTLEVGAFASYDWSTGGMNPSITVSEPGSVTITVTNEDGCEGVASVTIIENPLPEVEIDGELSFCDGDSTALMVGDFVTYTWSTADTTASIFANSTGNYQVIVTDENGCEGQDMVEVSSNPNPEVMISGLPQFCEGDSTSLDAGTFADYEWSTGAMTQTINVDEEAIYEVTVTDDNGCLGMSTIDVMALPQPTFEIEGGSGFCPGDSTALSVPEFENYEWSTGAMTQSIFASTGMAFSVTVTNENGCMGQSTLEVTEFSEPEVEIMGALAFCEGDSTVLDAGDFMAYAWTGGSETAALTVLAEGTYGVTVTDDNGCQAEAEVEVMTNLNPEVNIAGDDTYCAGDSTQLDAGSFETYLWSTMEETAMIQATDPGIYEVEVTDLNGCAGMATIEIGELPLPEPEIEGSLSFCPDGSTTLVTGDFTSYEWSNGGMMSGIEVMEAGPYSVTVEDANGCQGEASVEVAQAPDIELEITGALSFCDGDSTQLEAGTFETYEWSTGDMSSTITINASGNYAVTVTDTLGCSAETSVMVQENDPVELNIDGPGGICAGNPETLTATAGFETYEWSSSEDGNEITINSGGIYMVTVTDGAGCMGMAILEIDESPALTPEISGDLTICEGETTTLTVDVYETYLWSTGAITASIETTIGGSYTVTVTDENGCNGQDTVEVDAIAQPQPEILGASEGICNGESVELLASGDGAFTWIDPDGSLNIIGTDVAVANPTQSVTYGLVATNECFSDTAFLNLELFDLPMVDAGVDIIIRPGEEARLEPSGGVNYEWTGGNGLSCIACASPLAAPETTTTFMVLGIDENGCQGLDSVTVTVLTGEVKLVDPINAFTPNNDGVNDFFVIKEIEQFADHKLTIFNRWGDTVFESLDYQNEWDGTYNGEPLPAGTYLYVLVIDVLGEKEVIKSTITIVRE